MEFAIQAWSSYLKCDKVCTKKVDGELRNCGKSFVKAELRFYEDRLAVGLIRVSGRRLRGD